MFKQRLTPEARQIIQDLNKDMVLLDSKKKHPIRFAWQKRQSSDTVFNSFQYAILTGEPSGIVVIDVDTKGIDFFNADILPLLQKKKKKRIIVETPSGGFHYYFQYNAKTCLNLKSRSNIFKPNSGIDFRGNSGCIIGPGSLSDFCYGKKCSFVCTPETCKYQNRPYRLIQGTFSPGHFPMLPKSVISKF